MSENGQLPGVEAIGEEAQRAAALLADAFEDYHARFSDITRRARRRFESRDWRGAEADQTARIELYDACIAETLSRLEALLGDRVRSRGLWIAIRAALAARIDSLLDGELYKTFYNSVTRRFFHTRGVDQAIEFVALDITPTDRITHPVARHVYAVGDDLAATFADVLAAPEPGFALADAAHDAQALARTLDARVRRDGARVHALELMQTVFYRERRAYLVGRAFGAARWWPLVIALAHGDDGIRVDALLTEPTQVAQLFGFSRSYFHADLATVGDAVVFLRALLPHKPVDELYTVLGRAKQGKTERYRHFFRHLQAHGDDRFVHADGERGLVMLVFTLPGYPLVFKVIRDRFAYPKTGGRDDVQAKYRLVFRHDRIGRLVDAQEFRALRFPRARFEPALLRELLEGCADTASLDGDDVVIGHCYVERRVRPLDLYLREASPDAARAAVVDYGQAIADLARSNIFPGDLLLKNFGVSRHGRVIFYDYDELCLLSECRFRALPQPRHDEDETRGGEWFYVGAHDVFPEQFPRFLGLPGPLHAALMDAHGHLFDVRWWLDVQDAVAQSRASDVAPYPHGARLAAEAGA